LCGWQMTLVPLSSVKAPEGAVSRRLFAWPWQHARAAQQLAANATTDANATVRNQPTDRLEKVHAAKSVTQGATHRLRGCPARQTGGKQS
jgi:hypothetical protein